MTPATVAYQETYSVACPGSQSSPDDITCVWPLQLPGSGGGREKRSYLASVSEVNHPTTGCTTWRSTFDLEDLNLTFDLDLNLEEYLEEYLSTNLALAPGQVQTHPPARIQWLKTCLRPHTQQFAPRSPTASCLDGQCQAPI